MNQLTKQNVPFGMVPNSLLNDENISFKAKGLFAYMQSKPEGWSFSVKLIATQSKESKDAVSTGLKELESAGYLVREIKSNGVEFFTEYKLIFSADLKIVSYDGKPVDGKPVDGKPYIGKSVNNSKKELSNKELSKKEEREGALAFFEDTFPTEYERLMMQHKSRINDYQKFAEMFEATVMQEGLIYELHVLKGRFLKFARNWIDNQNKYDSVLKVEKEENTVYSKLKIS